MPVYVHVIDHPDARVLVDTGMTELHPAMADMAPRLQPLSEQDFDSPPSTLSSTRTCTPTTAAATTSSPASRSMSSVGSSTTRAARTSTPFASGSRRPACGTCRSTASSSCFRGSGLSRRRATPAACRWSSSRLAGVRSRRRRRGGVVRRVRRAAHRRPAAGPRARPRARLAHARARAVATPQRLRHHAGHRQPVGLSPRRATLAGMRHVEGPWGCPSSGSISRSRAWPRPFSSCSGVRTGSKRS